MSNHVKPLHFFRTSPILSYIMIAVISVSCTARLPMSSIYAQNQDTNELIKWPEIKDENENHRIRVTPQENVGDMLLFEVEVTNKSIDPLHINPQSWQLEYFRDQSYENTSPADSVSLALNGGQINNEYHKIAQKIKKARDGTTAWIVVGIAVVIVVAIIVASAGGDDDDDKKSRESNRVRRDRVDSNFNFFLNLGVSSYSPPRTEEWTPKQKIDYYRQRGEFLRELDYGPQTIEPNETRLFGFFFPRKASMKRLKLIGSVDDQKYNWEFRHQHEKEQRVIYDL